MKSFSIIMSIIFVICICSFVVVFTINQNVTFRLIGEEIITIDVGSSYEDEGVTATAFDKDISDKVQIKNKVDYNKIGSYDINYYLTYVGKIYMLTRTINIVDSVSPEIKLNGNNFITIYVGEEYEDEGAVAYDNYDGDVSDKIEVTSEVDSNKAGNYIITYDVKDSSGNESSAVRKIKVVE